MRCAEFERRIQRICDLRRAPQHDRKLARHAAHCEHCHARLRAYERMLGSLALLAEESICAAVSERERSRADQPRRGERAVWPITAAGRGSLAASLLLAIVFGLTGSRLATHSTTAPRASSRFLAAVAAPQATGPQRFWDWKLANWTESSFWSSDTLDRIAPVAEGLRPVAESMGTAWHAVRDALPVGSTAQQTTRSS